MFNNITVTEILNFIILLVAVITSALLLVLYLKMRSVENKIEKIHQDFEETVNGLRGQGRGITETIINNQIAELANERDKKVAPLEREKQRLLAKIPFLK